MNQTEICEALEVGDTYLGIELGSTRIKGVLIGPDHVPLASGAHDWENQYVDKIWTYSLEAVWNGLRNCYGKLAAEVEARYGLPLRRVGAMGISGMMHGYLPFDREGELLTPFRTWRNTTTGPAAAELTRLLAFNIPQRWSVAHFYQAVLNGESHVKEVAFLTTLAGYVHWKLTGEQVLGVGEASGMFPIDSSSGTYDPRMARQLEERLEKHGLPIKLETLLPRVLPAGTAAGRLTTEGARLLDPSGILESGAALCPPEGDAGTGMVATNAVAPRTGNVSAGTSVFAMIVLEKPLPQVHEEIDLVTTPEGNPVAMVHCNNCTNEINAWAEMLGEFLNAIGVESDRNRVYSAMFCQALEGEPDGGGLLLYNYLSGEPITKLEAGCPLLVRAPETRFTFANLMRTQLYSALATLRIGINLLSEEGVAVDRLMGHGGFFKTPGVGQKMMAAAAGVPISVLKTAGEGGPWGMALLAAFLKQRELGETLSDYLRDRVFAGEAGTCVDPDPAEKAGFETFLSRYEGGLPIERIAVSALI
ncbi:MAG: FGGY-family carbohydrate kinase [Lawsonibacter sp.]|nr:FGGY-family carbohydrate kinase [Lawsonibacter sp.]